MGHESTQKKTALTTEKIGINFFFFLVSNKFYWMYQKEWATNALDVNS